MRSSDEQWAFQSVNDSLRSRGWAACINAAAGAQKSGDELAAVEKVIAEGDAPKPRLFATRSLEIYPGAVPCRSRVLPCTWISRGS